MYDKIIHKLECLKEIYKVVITSPIAKEADLKREIIELEELINSLRMKVFSQDPLMLLYKDGNMFCAIDKDFKDLQQSDCGFGETPIIALLDLLNKKQAKDDSTNIN